MRKKENFKMASIKVTGKSTSPKFLAPWLFALVIILSIFYTDLQAQTKLKEGQRLSKEALSDSARVLKEVEISREIHRYDHNEALEIKHAQRAVDIALNISDSLLYAYALDNLGLLYRFHQKYKEAIPLHVKAVNLINGFDEEKLANMIYANNAGVAFRYAQEFDKAVYYYMHALEIAEQEQDLKNIAISSNGLGNTLLHIPNREDDAIAYFERALEAETKRENSLGIAMNYLSISDYYTEKEEFLKARIYLEKLLNINKERKDEFGLAITYQFLGLNYFKEGRKLNVSQDYFLKSLSSFKELGNRHKQAELLQHIGDVNNLRNKFEEAIKFYNQSLNLAKETKNIGLLMEIYKDLYLIFEKKSDISKAFENFKLFQLYKDSLALKEQETAIAAIEKRYKLEKKESQIALLKKDKILQHAQFVSQEETLRSQKFILIILIVGLLAIGLIAMMQYRNIKIKKKSNQLLLHRNQQIINQRDEISLQRDEIEKVNGQLEQAFAELIDQQKKNEERRIKLIESKFEYKIQSLALQSLESQMNPHFLFNGMNAVRWLVVQNKNKEAMDYLNTFAQLLRLSLTNNRKNVIPLQEELQTTCLYLEIEKLRFNSEFTFSLNIASEIEVHDIMVPPKILQPLAENAVKHGLLPSQKLEKKLDINVIKKNGAVCVEVVDNGIGYKRSLKKDDEPKEDGTHLGLKLIYERLSIYNEQNENLILFKIEPYKDEMNNTVGTRAEIQILKEEIVELAEV